MGQLVLVRHGQASFFADDYDKLSEMGEAQARKLAEYWLRYDVRFDEAFSGSLKRQTRTEEVVAEVYRAAGVDWPERQTMDSFNEYDADGVMHSLLPELIEADERVAALNEELQAASDGPTKYRAFHRLLESVMAVWVTGRYDATGFETWDQFSTRVREAMIDVTKGRTGGKRIAVFSSGGVIGTTIQTVMQAPDMMALELNWRIHNGATSEIVFSRGRYTMSSFNTIPHLDDPRFWTYR